MSNNKLSGTIPENFGIIGNLKDGSITLYGLAIIYFNYHFLLFHRDFSNNKLYGTIPNTIGSLGLNLSPGNVYMYVRLFNFYLLLLFLIIS